MMYGSHVLGLDSHLIHMLHSLYTVKYSYLTGEKHKKNLKMGGKKTAEISTRLYTVECLPAVYFFTGAENIFLCKLMPIIC